MATVEGANAKGNAGIALGSTAVGIEVLRALTNGGLGNILGGNANNGAATAAAASAAIAAMAGAVRSGDCGCSENHVVNRYELGLQQSNAAKDSEIALLRANIYGDQKLVEVYKYIDGELKDIRGTLGEQAVMNQKTSDSFDMVRNDMICCKNELYQAINRERDERCCGDNTIVNYVNATFYPKMVADVTTGTTTSAQTLYNPIRNCGNCCGNN
ncbi:MAG: hypothetical protein ACI3XQ_11465 [Eubacteriales bacterium]